MHFLLIIFHRRMVTQNKLYILKVRNETFSKIFNNADFFFIVENNHVNVGKYEKYLTY